jgi:hypothetical protein
MKTVVKHSLALLTIAGLFTACSDYSTPVQPSQPNVTVISATGDITAKINEFRTLLGDPNNGGQAGQKPSGRREVAWDGAGAKPFNNRNDFPATFFNVNAKNGIVFTTNGTPGIQGFQPAGDFFGNWQQYHQRATAGSGRADACNGNRLWRGVFGRRSREQNIVGALRQNRQQSGRLLCAGAL